MNWHRLLMVVSAIGVAGVLILVLGHAGDLPLLEVGPGQWGYAE